MRYLKRCSFLACLLLFLSSCQTQEFKDSQLALVKKTNPKPVYTDQDHKQDHVKEIKKDVSSQQELYDVAVVKGKEDTLVVYKVKHLHRFKMKEIEKEITKMLEKKYPNENFTVSSDYKIFLEAIRLDEKIKNDKYTDKQAENQLKNIVRMTNTLK